MGKKKRADELDAEDKSAARDFMMARLAAARGSIAKASIALDAMCEAMADPAQDDPKGKHREMYFEDLDDALGRAAIAVAAAREAWEEVDPEEGEPEPDEDEEDDEEDDEDNED